MSPQLFSMRSEPERILCDQAALLRTRAMQMPAGVERDRLLKQAREAETRANLASWAQSPGLQPPV